MLHKEKKLIIVGDPIEDIYATVQDGKTLDTCTLHGGALNTYHNAKTILSKTILFTKVKFVPELKFENKYLYKILRLNNQPDIHLCKNINKEDYYSDIQYIVQRQFNSLLNESSYESVLVFSDYNKGTLNVHISKYEEINKVKLAIVDSKYNSLHSSLFDFAENYIWRCTGEEYNSDFAKRFDYVIWTDGQNPIKLLDKKQNVIKIFKVPAVNVVDSCGAGDTFTASFASYMFKSSSLKIKNIEEAILFSIKASVDVIQKSKTAITNIKI